MYFKSDKFLQLIIARSPTNIETGKGNSPPPHLATVAALPANKLITPMLAQPLKCCAAFESALGQGLCYRSLWHWTVIFLLANTLLVISKPAV